MSYSMKYLEKKDKIRLVIAALSVVLQCWLELKIPEFTSQLTLQFQTTDIKIGDVLVPGALMLACALGSLLLALISGYIIADIGTKVSMKIRSAAFRKAMSFSLQEMSHFESSSLITRCTQNIDFILRFWINGPLYFVKAICTMVIAIIKMSTVDIRWIFTIGSAVVISLVFVFALIIVTTPKISMAQVYSDDLNRLVGEHMSGIRIVHAFNAYRHQTKTFDETNEKMTKLGIFGNYMSGFLLPGLMTIVYMLTIAIYITGLGLISSAPMAERAAGYADMIEFTSYATLMVQAVVNLIRGIAQIPGNAISIRRIREVLEMPMTITDGDGEERVDSAPVIEFKNVFFKYPGIAEDKGADVLRDISFKVNRGETVAFIGDTGCGKSTLLNLIPRLYEAGQGNIYINGSDIRGYKLGDLRSLLGYVPQKARLFTRSISANIDFGDDGGFAKSLTEIRNAAKVGQADEFIRQKPQGYDTQVLSGGSNFSGGQRQRLTISRAVCRDPEIYLFDDSFSALDFKTDKELRRALKKHAAGATMVIVAQRISTILNADKIFVMDKGRIVDSGTHDELMKSCRIYQEIASTQMATE